MILNDRWIKDNSWIIEPFNEVQVNPNSYDLTWSGNYRTPIKVAHDVRVIDTKDKTRKMWGGVHNAETMYIHPQELFLLDTIEALQIPTNVMGLLRLKSSIARVGLESLDAGIFDSGFGLGNPSTATLEVYNCSPFILKIHKGQPLVQIVFMQAYEPERDYRVTGRFNGQRAPVSSKEEIE